MCRDDVLAECTKQVLVSLEKSWLNCSLQSGSSSGITQIAGNSHLQSICGPSLRLYCASLVWWTVPELGGSQPFKSLLWKHILVCCPSGVTDESAVHVSASDLKGRGHKLKNISGIDW